MDVSADGNCLFHALAKIPAVPYDSEEEIRQAVVSYVMNSKARNCEQLNELQMFRLQHATKKYHDKIQVDSWATNMS